MHAPELLERRIQFAVPAESALPVLNSSPGAPVTLYLDFHGEPQQQWGGRIIPATPTPLLDNGQIKEAFETVANAYLRFNINVTTIDPGGWDPGGKLPHGHQFRVVVGGDGSWTGAVEGGIADVGSYADSWDPNTAFVFSNWFSNGRDVGLECIHEAGHGFGLQHQSVWANGVKTAEYAPGYYMGNPFSGVLIGWGTGLNSLGEPQDDAAILSSMFGTNPHYHPGDQLILPGVTADDPNSTEFSGEIDEIREKPRKSCNISRLLNKSGSFLLTVLWGQIRYGPRCRAAW